MRKLFIAAGFIPIIVLANPMFDGHPGCHDKGISGVEEHMQKHGKHDDLFFKELELTAEQQSQIEMLKRQDSALMQERMDEEKSLHQQLHQLTMSTDYSAESTDSLIQQISIIKTAALKQRVETDHQIFNMLTDEQKTKLISLTPPKSE